MIYLVSDKIDCSSMEGITKLSVDDSLSMISSWPVVQYDSETNGLDCHVNKMTAMQFGYYDYSTGDADQIVVDVGTIDPRLYKEVLENSYLIGHNIKFDIEFLYNYGIIPLNVYDTMVCEQVLYMGYNAKRVGFSLKHLYNRYTGEELDKSFQKRIATQGLTERGIRYSAQDVVHLQEIRQKQIMIAESRNCTKAFVLENRFVPAIAYLEWCGIHLDENKWRAKMTNDQVRFDTVLAQLNDYVMTNTKLNTKFVTTITQLDLFSQSDNTGPVCAVDWSSSKQVIPVCQALGFNTKTIDKNTKKPRDSVEWDVLSTQKGIDDAFLKMYSGYKEAEKKISTYGQNFLNLVNPNTNRLHTEFKQIGTVTGRMSSGGGDEGDSDAKGKMNKDLARLKHMEFDEVRYVNLQNLPARGEEGKITRACFTPMANNIFLSCDFSAEELVNLIFIYNN